MRYELLEPSGICLEAFDSRDHAVEVLIGMVADDSSNREITILEIDDENEETLGFIEVDEELLASSTG